MCVHQLLLCVLVDCTPVSVLGLRCAVCDSSREDDVSEGNEIGECQQCIEVTACHCHTKWQAQWVRVACGLHRMTLLPSAV